MLKGNAIVGQSGGPTSVINSSLAGVIETAMKSEHIEAVYGMNFGIQGFMEEQLLDLSAQGDWIIEGLKHTPSSALGSSRHKLTDDDFPNILEVLRKYRIHYFFLIGGNDTMDTVHRIETYCSSVGWPLKGIGIPKTVDNDLFGTDHTPGFASAARYNMLSVLQAGTLARDMRKVDTFAVYQTIGRDAGWLAAATALAKKSPGDAPHLIYCPERVFDPVACIEDAKACVEKYGWVSIVVSEGLTYADGTPVSASETTDKFNNVEYGAMGGGSVGLSVHRILSKATGWRGEFQITESLIMSAADRGVQLDFDEAYQCGVRAVELAAAGETGIMVTIDRISTNPYTVQYGTAPLSDVGIRAKSMPDEYLNEAGNGVTDACIEYLKPLVGEIPDYVRLKPLFAKEMR